MNQNTDLTFFIVQISDVLYYIGFENVKQCMWLFIIKSTCRSQNWAYELQLKNGPYLMRIIYTTEPLLHIAGYPSYLWLQWFKKISFPVLYQLTCYLLTQLHSMYTICVCAYLRLTNIHIGFTSFSMSVYRCENHNTPENWLCISMTCNVIPMLYQTSSTQHLNAYEFSGIAFLV